MDRDLLDVFNRNCLQIVLGTQLTDCISNVGLYKKCGSILLSRNILRDRLRFLGHILWMKDNRLLKIVLVCQPSRAKWKVCHLWLG